MATPRLKNYLLNAATNKPKLDVNHAYRKKCGKLAKEIGFSEAETLSLWIEVCLLKMYAGSIPQAAAEADALACVRAMLDKRGVTDAN